MRKRIVGYARVSTDRQDLVRQKILIQDYCSDNGYQLIRIISEKVSGAKKDRQSINELMEVDNTVADMVVVSELSRISRQKEILSVLNTINGLLENGLDILFLDDPDRIYNAYMELELYDIIMLTVKAHAAAEERDKITYRMNTGKRTKLQVNPYMYTGGLVPYGFQVVDNPEYVGQKNDKPATKLMVVDNDKIANVKLIYKMVLNGSTLRDTAKYVNSLGLRTQLDKPFCETSVAKMIRNKIYNGKRIVKNICLDIEKIIPDDEFNMANIKMASNQLFKGKGHKNFNPLKGIIFCPCGYAMMLHKMSRRNQTAYFVLACCKKGSSIEYRKICSNSGIESQLLFNIVWHVVRNTLQLSEYTVKNDEQVNNINTIVEQLESKLYETINQIDDVKKQKTKIEKAITLVSIPTLISKYEAEYVRLESKQGELESEKGTIQAEISKYKSEIDKLLSIANEHHLANLTDQEKANVYKNVLSRVEYYSFNFRKGFIVISYKNGLENIVAVQKSTKGFIALLPSSFEFNKETRKVQVKVSSKRPTLSNFTLKDFQTNEYDFNELEANFDVGTWKIYL